MVFDGYDGRNHCPGIISSMSRSSSYEEAMQNSVDEHPQEYVIK
jgi:hypothetical protein